MLLLHRCMLECQDNPVERETPPQEFNAEPRYPRRERHPPARLLFEPFDEDGNERLRYEETTDPYLPSDQEGEEPDLALDWVFGLVSSSSDEDASTDEEFTDPGTPASSSVDTSDINQAELEQELAELTSVVVDTEADWLAQTQDRHPHLIFEFDTDYKEILS